MNAIRKQLVAFLGLYVWLAASIAYAQQCLHGANETADEAARRREALTATRTINNIQANQPGAAKGQFLRHEDLLTRTLRGANAGVGECDCEAHVSESRHRRAPELAADSGRHQSRLLVHDQGQDRPLRVCVRNNQGGLIFQAEPIR